MTESPKNKTRRQLIGWREWAALPDLGIDFFDAKIDTGARSSALGAYDVRQIRKAGRSFVEFRVQPDESGSSPAYLCRAPYTGTRVIRSSNGREEERVVIEARIGLGGILWKIDLTLANRDAMDFQLLIGRIALGRKFLVNPAASYLLGR